MPIPTPAQAFGIAPRTTADFFRRSTIPERLAPGQEQFLDPQYQALIQQDRIDAMERERQQRQLESDAAAAQFLSGAGGMDAAGIQEQLARNPALLQSTQFPAITNFMQQKQAFEAMPQPGSNRILANPLRQKFQDPISIQRFDQYVQSGMEAADAYEEVLGDMHNDNQAIKLIESGVDPSVVESLRSKGRIDPVSAAGLAAKAKRDAELAKKSVDSPKALPFEAIKWAKENSADDAEFNANIELIARNMGITIPGSQATPAPSPTGAPGAGVGPTGLGTPPVVPFAPAGPVVPQNVPTVIPTRAEREAAKAQESTAGERKAIEETWQKNQDQFERMLLENVSKDPNELLTIAADIARGELDQIQPSLGESLAMPIPSSLNVIGKLGKNPDDVAFTEPGKGRKTLGIFGSQDVRYPELAQAWAKSFLAKSGYDEQGRLIAALDQEKQNQDYVKRAEQRQKEEAERQALRSEIKK